jgi:hypothetical protein
VRASLPLLVVLGALAMPRDAPGRPASTAARKPVASYPLALRVVDQDTGQPVAARLIVTPSSIVRGPRKNVEDTADGTLLLRLPRGRYLVTATRGPEYTADQREVSLDSGAPPVELRLRRVIDPGPWVSSDLHVHSSQSFDSRVTPEQQLRSLAAAAITFAAPTEHNVVGTFPQASAERLGITWLPAMEVTPAAPAIGHFTVLAYAGETAPTVRGVGAKDLLAQLRQSHPDALLQINHPRLSGGMGFFNVIQLNATRSKSLSQLPPQVDTLEVLNGKEMLRPAQVERTFREWMQLLELGYTYWGTSGSDVHHKEQAAGYPRTYIRPLADEAPSPRALVKALRRGRAVVTTGPMLELRQGERLPGDTLQVEGRKATVQVRVRAAPWVDVSQVELWAGGKKVWSRALAPRPLRTGPPGADAEQERSAAVLLDEAVTVELPEGARALVAAARGERPVGKLVPLGSIPSFAFTNPLRIPEGASAPQPPR